MSRPRVIIAEIHSFIRKLPGLPRRLPGIARSQLYLWHLRIRPVWLTEAARQELSKIRKQDGSLDIPHASRVAKLKRLVSCGLAVPITAGLVVVAQFLLAALLVLLSRYTELPRFSSGFLASLWEVEAAILGLALVVVTLLLQSRAVASRSHGLFRFYIEDAAVVPVAVWGFAQIVSTGLIASLPEDVVRNSDYWQGMLLSNSLSFIVYIGLNLWAFWKTIQCLSPSSPERARIVILRRGIADSVAERVRLLVGRALLDRFCKAKGIYRSPLGDTRPDLAPIRTDKIGRITNVDLRRLAHASGALRHSLRYDASTQETYRALLAVDLGDLVGPSRDVLIRLHPSDLNDDLLRTFREAFVISTYGDQPDDELLHGLDLLRDEVISALDERRASAFSQLLDLYADLTEQLLRIWRAHRLPLDVSSASLFELGRTPLSMIVSHLFDIIRRTIQSEDQEMIDVAMYAPIKSSRLAFRFNQSATFRDFASMMIGAYRLVGMDRVSQRREFVTDRSWRYLSELAQIELVWPLRRDAVPDDDIPRHEVHLGIVMEVFEQLLKAAIDYADATTFRAVGQALERIVGDLEPHAGAADAETLAWRLRTQSMDAHQRKAVEKQLERLRLLEGLASKLQRRSELLWFGLSAWILRQIRDGKMERRSGVEMVSFARSHLSDLRNLSRLFLNVLAKGAMGLPWDNWILSELPEGDVHWIDTESWTRFFYCVQGLRLTPDELGTDDTPIMPDRNLRHKMESLTKTCDEIRSLVSELEGVVTDSDIERIEPFLELHRRAVGVAQREYKRWMIAEPLSTTRIEAFRKEALQAFSRSVSLHSALATLGEGMLQYGTTCLTAPGETVSVDWLEQKAAFVDDPYVQYIDVGGVYGNLLGRRVDNYLLQRLRDALQIIPCAQHELITCIRAVRAMLEQQGYRPSMVFLPDGFWRQYGVQLRHAIRSGGGRPRSESPWYVGKLDDMEVVTGDTRVSTSVLVADVRALRPTLRFGGPEQGGGPEIRVDMIDEAEARRLVDESPGMVQRLDAASVEDAVWILQQRVKVRLCQYLHVELADPDAAILIDINTTQDGRQPSSDESSG